MDSNISALLFNRTVKICEKKCPKECLRKTQDGKIVYRSTCLDTIIHSAFNYKMPVITFAKALCLNDMYGNINKPLEYRPKCQNDVFMRYFNAVVKKLIKDGELDINKMVDYIKGKITNIEFDEKYYNSLTYNESEYRKYLESLKEYYYHQGSEVYKITDEECVKYLNRKGYDYCERGPIDYLACKSYIMIKNFDIPPWLSEMLALHNLEKMCGVAQVALVLYWLGELEFMDVDKFYIKMMKIITQLYMKDRVI